MQRGHGVEKVGDRRLAPPGLVLRRCKTCSGLRQELRSGGVVGSRVTQGGNDAKRGEQFDQIESAGEFGGQRDGRQRGTCCVKEFPHEPGVGFEQQRGVMRTALPRGQEWALQMRACNQALIGQTP